MYRATVVNFKLKVQILMIFYKKKLLQQNPLNLTLCQKLRREKYDFPEKVPFWTSLMYVYR